MKEAKPTKTSLQWFGSVDEGRQLEILGVDGKGEPIKELPYPLFTLFQEEKNEELLIEYYDGREPIQMKVSELKRAIELAEAEAHSEQWYETNVYSKMEAEPDDRSNG